MRIASNRDSLYGLSNFIFCCFLFCGGGGGVKILTLSTLWATSAAKKLVIFVEFSQKIGFDISCKLFAMEMLCKKCQTISFFGVGVIFDP